MPAWRRDAAAEDSPLLLAEAVVRLLRAHGDGRGCVLVVEDLHWADPETLAALDYLGDALPTEPVLCVATARPEGAAAELLERLERRDPPRSSGSRRWPRTTSTGWWRPAWRRRPRPPGSPGSCAPTATARRSWSRSCSRAWSRRAHCVGRTGRGSRAASSRPRCPRACASRSGAAWVCSTRRPGAWSARPRCWAAGSTGSSCRASPTSTGGRSSRGCGPGSTRRSSRWTAVPTVGASCSGTRSPARLC